MLRTLLVQVFIVLSHLGLRNRLLRIFAYFPLRTPSYTFRDYKQEDEEDCEYEKESSDKCSLFNNQYSLKQGLSSLLQNDQLASANVSHKKSKYQLTYDDTEQLRYHRVSSVITEKEMRPYKIPVDDNSEMEDLKIYEKEEKLLSAKTISPKLVKLINRNKQAINIRVPDDMKIDGYYLKTKENKIIACIVVQPLFYSPDLVFIHSHPNHPDIGLMIDTYLDLCYNLQVAVIGYDYAGYGQSEGEPDDKSQICEIEAVYQFAVHELGVAWNNIILYGQSIGSGPSVMLSANSNCLVGGLIIHSGFMSGLRIIDPDIKKTSAIDLFPNIDYIAEVNCPILIIHGTEDKQVDMRHVKGQQLASAARNLFQVWFCEKGGHNNIEYEKKFRTDYFRQLRNFTKEIMMRNHSFKMDELKKLYRANLNEGSFTHIYQKLLGDRANTKSIFSVNTKLKNSLNRLSQNENDLEESGSLKDISNSSWN